MISIMKSVVMLVVGLAIEPPPSTMTAAPIHHEDGEFSFLVSFFKTPAFGKCSKSSESLSITVLREGFLTEA